MTTDSDVKLPISAIIPVLNCAHRMRAHMERAMEWLTEVAEIIVVDSHSNDETVSIIMEFAGHLHPQVIDTPPGLYASWNRGVQEATSPFVYFSTVGDHISLDGLKKLLHTMKRLQADVVVSPPEFTYETKELEKNSKRIVWPIHEVIQRLQINEPTWIDPITLYDFILVYLESSILGSSASNLYRRSVLQRFPFSDDFLSAGDSAWIVEHNFDVRTVILPEVISTYLFHNKDWLNETPIPNKHQTLRRRLAYMAYTKFIEISSMPDCLLGEQALTAIKDSLEKSCREDERRPVDTSLLTNVIRRLSAEMRSAEMQSILEKLQMVSLEADYQNRKGVELLHRERLGAFRYLWLPAVLNRAKRKNLKRRIDSMIEKFKSGNSST